MRRGRYPAWLLLVTLLLFLTAGCSGGGGGAADEPAPGPDDAAPAADETEEWTPFALKPGQYFRYKTSSTTGGRTETGKYILQLSEAGKGQIEVAWEGTLGDTTFASTATADNGEEALAQMYTGMMLSPAAAPVIMTILAPWWNMFFAGRSWTVGNSWSFTAEGHSAAFEITGRETYAGVQGYLGRWTQDGELRVEMCVSPDLPLALMARYVMDGQELASELVEYRGP